VFSLVREIEKRDSEERGKLGAEEDVSTDLCSLSLSMVSK
jgi:hypothetical protein